MMLLSMRALGALALLVAAAAQESSPAGSVEHWRALARHAENQEPPPPSAPQNGTFFAGSLTDHAVLQKGTAHAAVYGVSFGATAETKVTVTVSEKGETPYTVAADLIPTGHAGNVTWKALLHPHADQGGSATISAACSGCTNTTAATIKAVTWGDVFFCFGQSNMWLPMQHTFTRNRTYSALDRAEDPLYKNIRTIKREQMVKGGARWDGDELYILPPPPPPSGGRFSPSPTHNSSMPGPWIPANAYYGWQVPNSTTVNEFSGECERFPWYLGGI